MWMSTENEPKRVREAVESLTISFRTLDRSTPLVIPSGAFEVNTIYCREGEELPLHRHNYFDLAKNNVGRMYEN